MGKKTESEDQAGHFTKDSRRARKREEDAKAHHVWYERKGPNVIIRSQLGGTRTSFEAEDVFHVSCDHAGHSLNKRKRWEMVEKAEKNLLEKSSPGKTSFVEATLTAYPGRHHLHWQRAGQMVDDDGFATGKQGGGIKKYVEMKDGEMIVKKSNTGKTTLGQLESTAGPGPLLRQNRHRSRKVKGGQMKEEEDGSLSDPSDDRNHVRYTTLEVQKRDGKTIERSWRWGQSQYSWKKSGKRKPCIDREWDDEDQDELEEDFDELKLNIEKRAGKETHEEENADQFVKEEKEKYRTKSSETAEMGVIVEPKEDAGFIFV